MSSMIHTSPNISVAQDTDPAASFLLGGYSWVKKRFELWNITFSASENRFAAHPGQWIGYSEGARKFVLSSNSFPPEPVPSSKIAFAGDHARTSRELLGAKLTAKHPTGKTFVGVDWEPFEVVRDLLRNPDHSETIGGAPQVVKVYQYMRSSPLCVQWPNRDGGKVFLQGRDCLGYENIDRWILDPDTLESTSPFYSKNDDDLLTEEESTITEDERCEPR
jgi:hypothetical protein